MDFGGWAAVGVCAEAFQVDDEVLRKAGESDFLGSFAGDVASGAFPAFVAAESLIAAELGEALVEGGGGAALGDFDADAGEELPGCADEAAGAAAEGGHCLAAEEVVDWGVLAVAMALPFAFGGEVFGEAFAELFLFESEILEDVAVEVAVEIFVETLDHELEELFGILLLAIGPFGVETTAESAESSRLDA